MVGRGDAFNMANLDKLVRRIAGEVGIDSLALAGMSKLGSTRIKLSGQALETIVWEVLENAQKFHPEQSPSLEVEISGKSDCLCIRVEDDGVALTAEQLTRIWTPYYQAERGFSGQVPGMGLGLAMVASLIWSVGGSCRAINRLDRAGLVVEVELPLYEADKAG